MTTTTKTLAAAALLGAVAIAGARQADAEILAMMNYESKSPDSLKALKLSAAGAREEGIAIVDVDPASPAFGTVLMTIPLPADLIAHHIFFDRTQTKAYLTALGKPLLHVIDLQRYPYRLQRIEVPDCRVGEDVIFAGDNRTWYLTCMGSQNIIVGDVASDEIKAVIDLPKPYPHGFAIHQGIDRALVTSTVRASDLGDAGETITVLQPSTNAVLGSLKVSNKPSPSRAAPVEILFVPGSQPPTAYITNMYEGTLWAATWNPARQDFDVADVFDFGTIGAGVPLEMYFSPDARTLYVTTAKPGKFHIFDLADGVLAPRLVTTIDAAAGAHHVGLTRDGRYAVVQNALLNLPGMSDGSLTVIDLAQKRVVGRVDTLKNLGFNPNSLVLLPPWNDLGGH